MSWVRLKEYRELNPSEYVDWNEGADVPPGRKLVFISHRWIAPEHPDPTGEQLRDLQQRLNLLLDQDKDLEASAVFYDYCSMPQRPRTPQEDVLFYGDIASLRALSLLAYKIIILSEGYSDYKNRAWCFFEAMISQNNVHFFDDQTHIKHDLYFLDFLMSTDYQQVTSYDFSYKVNMSEAQIIAAVFQHLNACKVTHVEVSPLIKRQLIAHFNGRRLSSFGRLVTAVNKYFDVVFALMIELPGGRDVVDCKPFFEESEGIRLRDTDTNSLLLLLVEKREPSVFVLPRAKVQELRKSVRVVCTLYSDCQCREFMTTSNSLRPFRRTRIGRVMLCDR